MTKIDRTGWRVRAAAGLLIWGMAVATDPASAQDATRPSGTGGESMADATAREQDLTDQQARAHFSVGRAMYDAGRFAEAANEFQQAYDLSRRPTLLYNLYIAYRDSSQPARARDALRQYLAEVADAPNRLLLESRLEALDAQLAADEEQRAEAEAQRAAAVRAAEEAQAARERAEQQAARLAHVRPWWPWVVFGAGLAAVAVGVPLGVDANGQAQGIRDRCTQQDGSLLCRSRDLAANRSGIVIQAGVADGLWIGGAALAGTGLLLALLLPDDIVDTTQAAASCTADGCYGRLTLQLW